MTGADFIIAINLSISGLLAVAFLAIGFLDGRRPAARWFALGFGLGVLNFLFEFLLPRAGGAFAVGLAAYASFLAALAAFDVGLARLYARKVPWRTLALLFVAGCLVRIGIEGLPRDLFARQLAYQCPHSAMQLVGVALVWRAPRRLFDNLLLAVLALSTLHYLAKPFMAAASGGVGASAGGYAGTFYAMVSQSSGTVLGLMVALLLFIVLVRDILETLATRSETDPLSGLLNRRGFEERRDHALRQRASSGLPVSLVLCDLDHFKAVNDTHGHAVGDRVIVAFATLLAERAAGHHAVGRVGGEEFAILLPGANLPAARLFAETLRSAFAATSIPGLRPDQHFTASFGVAEAGRGESGAELQARADAALYAAKRGGRDCVRSAEPTPVGGGGRAPGAVLRSF